jgi:formate hydrogenlyase subunit 3/multisubunit Na+/H+ antiporter MnhD subunit
MVAIHAAWLILWWREMRLKNETSELFKWLFFIEIMSLIDFFLIYEQSWFGIGMYNVEFTDFKILFYGAVIIKWSHSGNLKFSGND